MGKRRRVSTGKVIWCMICLQHHWDGIYYFDTYEYDRRIN
jgi:hypothetical protein